MKRNLFLTFVLGLLIVLSLSGCSQYLNLEKKTYICAASDFTKINLYELTMPIKIVSDPNTTDITVVYYTASEKYYLNITPIKSQSYLNLERKQKEGAFVPSYTYDPSCYTEITLPESYGGELTLNCVSGSVSMNNVSLAKFNITVTSGDVALNKITTTDNSRIKVSSANQITVKSSVLTKLTIDVTTVTNLSVTDSTLSDYLTINLTTGPTNVENTTAKVFEISGSAGAITLRGIECDSLVSAKNTTGDIKIFMKGNRADYTTNLSSQTGIVDGATTGGSKTITAITNVGNVSVKYLG